MKIILTIAISFFICISSSQAKNNNNFYIVTSSKDTLYATLDVPTSVLKPNIVLIIAGSGPTDRDGNSTGGLQTNMYKMLSDSLKKSGIASLRYDKRGVGDSKLEDMNESKMIFQDFINDAILFIKKLRKSNQFSKIIIAGHSEGSLIGMIAAREAIADAYISIAGTGECIDKTISRQIKDNAPQYAPLADSILSNLKNGKMYKLDDTSKLTSVFRESVQPYLISWIQFDPIKELSLLHIPIMILQGSYDLQVSIVDAEKLRAVQPQAKYYIIEGMNHILKTTSNDKNENLATYYNPDLPLDRDIVEAIIQFSRK